MGPNGGFIQDDIEGYFSRLMKQDEALPEDRQESKSTKVMRKAALVFYINDCLDLRINFKKFKVKSAR